MEKTEAVEAIGPQGLLLPARVQAALRANDRLKARARERHCADAPVLLVRRDAETGDLAALECAQDLLDRLARLHGKASRSI